MRADRWVSGLLILQDHSGCAALAVSVFRCGIFGTAENTALAHHGLDEKVVAEDTLQRTCVLVRLVGQQLLVV